MKIVELIKSNYSYPIDFILNKIQTYLNQNWRPQTLTVNLSDSDEVTVDLAYMHSNSGLMEIDVSKISINELLYIKMPEKVRIKEVEVVSDGATGNVLTVSKAVLSGGSYTLNTIGAIPAIAALKTKYVLATRDDTYTQIDEDEYLAIKSTTADNTSDVQKIYVQFVSQD